MAQANGKTRADKVENSVSDDLSKAARVVRAEELRLPRNVRVIRPSDIKAMVDRLVAEIANAEQAQTVSKIADMELKINNLQNKVAKLQSDRDALAALAGDKEKQAEEATASLAREREESGAEIATLKEQLSENKSLLNARNDRIREMAKELNAVQEELERAHLAAEEDRRKLTEELEVRLESEREDMKDALAEARAERDRQAADAHEGVAQMREEMEEELKTAEAARNELEQSYREQLSEAQAALGAAKADARDSRAEILRQNDERLAELRQQMEMTARALEEEKKNLEAQYKERLAQAAREKEALAEHTETEKQEVESQFEQKLAEAVRAKEAALAEFENRNSELLEQRSELESRVNSLEEKAASLKAMTGKAQESADRLRKQAEALTQRIADLARNYDELNEHYQKQRLSLAESINKLKAGLSFAQVHSVYDCEGRIAQAGRCASALRGAGARLGAEVAGKLAAMLEKASSCLRESKDTYDVLLGKVDNRQADIGVIVELLKAEQLCRVYGGWIEELSQLTQSQTPG